MKLAIKAVDKPFNVFAILIIILVLGYTAFRILPKQTYPDINAGHVLVTIPYPEATAHDIEVSIAKEIESRLFTEIEDINFLRMISSAGYAVVHFKFNVKTGLDIDKKIDEIKKIIDELKVNFPKGVKDAQYLKFDFSKVVFMGIVLTSTKEISTYEFNNAAERIKLDLLSIPGIGDIQIHGKRDMEFSVFVKLDKLEKYNISVNEIYHFFNTRIKSKPAGKISIDSNDYNIRVVSDIENIQRINNQVLRFQHNGNPIYLRDLVDIKFMESPLENVTRFNEKDALIIGLTKKKGTDLLKIYDKVMLKMDKIKNQNWVKDLGFEFNFIQYQIDRLNEEIEDLQKSSLLSITFILFLLILFIGFRYALIVILSIPFSIIFVFIGLLAFGESFNFVARFGFSIVMGLVVDGAIVMSESYHRQIAEEKNNFVDAIKYSIEDVGKPILVAAITTMASFVPLFFFSGTVGQFMRIVPQTVILAIFGSIIFDHFVLPLLCRFFFSKHSDESIFDKYYDRFFKKYDLYDSIIFKLYSFNYSHSIYNIFNKIRKFSFKYPGFYMAMNILMLMSSFILLRFVTFEFFPAINSNNLSLNIKHQASDSIEDLDTALKKIEKQLDKYKYSESNSKGFIKDYIVYGGHEAISDRVKNTSGASKSLGEIVLHLIDEDIRELNSYQIADILYEELVLSDGIQLNIDQASSGPPKSADLNIDITGKDKVILRKLAEQVRDIVIKHPKVKTFEDNFSTSYRNLAFQFKVNYEKLASYGIESKDIQNFLSIIYYDNELAPYVYKEDIYKFKLRFNEKDKRHFDKLLIYSPILNKNVFLSDLVDIKLVQSPMSMQRKNLENLFSIKVNIMGKGETIKVINEITKEISEQINIPENYNIDYLGEKKDLDDSFSTISYIFMIAIVSVYLIIAIQFESFIQPLLANVSIIYSFFGIVLSLVLTDTTFSMVVMYGIISLVGITVNDDILLIDSVNKLRKKGWDRMAAIEESARIKARPVILTSVTMIAGVFPYIILKDPLWTSFSWTIIGGLIVATIQTLITLPLLYELLYRGVDKINDLFSNFRSNFRFKNLK